MSTKWQTGNDEISTKQMKEAIIRSGYLLEQRVEDILRKKDYFVQANPVFPYPDTEKSGEYDIDAIKSFGIYKLKQEQWEYNAIHLQIMCECKHNPQPLVFFSKEAGEEDSLLGGYDIKLSGFPLRFKEEHVYEGEVMGLAEITGIDRFHHYCTGNVSTQWSTFQLKQKDKKWMALHNDEQHDAFSSLIMALNYYTNNHYDDWVPSPDKIGEVDINIYYPLVILEGELYSAILKNGRLSLRKAKLIHFRKDFYDPKVKQILTYHFDVINEHYLPEYLKIIELEVTKVRNSLRRQKQKVISAQKQIHKEIDKAGKLESYRKFLEYHL